MKRVLWLLGGLVACAPRLDLNLQSVADVPNPVASRIEIVIDAGERQAFITTPSEAIPLLSTLVLPEGFELLPLQIEARAFVGEREVARGIVDVSPGQTEATIRFAVCSNGALEGLETCDDGNLTEGEGCDSTCKPTGCASGVSTPGELCFVENDDLLGPAQPLQVLAADFNDDGLPDLVSPYLEDGVVRVFTNQGAGVFGSFDEIPLPGVERLTLADLDQDGDVDLVASVHRLNFAPELVLFSNEGGAFSVGTPTTLSALDVSAIALGDLNGDGRLDLVFTDKNTSLLKVNLGKEGGNFAFQDQALSVGFEPVALMLEDTDNDGDLDALTLSASGSVSVLLNSAGVFTAELPLSVGGAPSALVTGNFIGDNLPDLAVAKQDGGSGKIRLFENRGGVFQVVADFDAPDSPSALIAADLDLDGDIDLAATSKTDSLIAVQFNNGAGQFDAPRDASGGLFDTRLGPVSLVVSDLNGDRVFDLVAAGENLGLLLSNP